jgi:hypothetical protein
MATRNSEIAHDGPDLQSAFQEQQDFSLVLGGPVFQFFRRSHLSGADGIALLHRRLIVIPGLAWLPLLLLTTVAAVNGVGGQRLSFFRDIEVHVRFLIALPILVAAELIVHSRITPVVRRFVERRIVVPEDLPLFDKAIRSALRVRNSKLIERGLLAVVYTFGLWLWQVRVGLDSATWYATGGGRWNLTPAGY